MSGSAAVDRRDETRHALHLLVLRGCMLALFALFFAYMTAIGSPPAHQLWLALLFGLALAASLPVIRLCRRGGAAVGLLQGQLWLDVALLTALLCLSGGYSNPLISLYLLPVLVAALLLPQRQAWLLALAVIAAYTVLMRWYAPIFGRTTADGGFHHHLVGMWFSFVLSVVLIVSVVARMAEQRRRHALQLAGMQQRWLRQRAVVSMGAQAAFDAHELGTPLNTMLLLTEELRQASDAAERERSCRLLAEQIDRCRAVLERLAERGRSLAGDGRALPVAQLVARALEEWHTLHPGLRLRREVVGSLPAAPVDALLGQVLVVLLDNARQAGATEIVVRLAADGGVTAAQEGGTRRATSPQTDSLRSRHGWLELTVEDDGRGFDADLLHQAGRVPLAGRAGGKGLGLFLVGFVMEQLEGTVHIANRDSGGAVVRLLWPVAA
ncbi:MAG: sensor histidine kinase [Zetaproteobacteria bacterium]|nr:MAG: sensor histidine kinase [Zetaproteobacteria bacterium]